MGGRWSDCGRAREAQKGSTEAQGPEKGGELVGSHMGKTGKQMGTSREGEGGRRGGGGMRRGKAEGGGRGPGKKAASHPPLPSHPQRGLDKKAAAGFI